MFYHSASINGYLYGCWFTRWVEFPPRPILILAFLQTDEAEICATAQTSHVFTGFLVLDENATRWTGTQTGAVTYTDDDLLLTDLQVFESWILTIALRHHTVGMNRLTLAGPAEVKIIAFLVATNRAAHNLIILVLPWTKRLATRTFLYTEGTASVILCQSLLVALYLIIIKNRHMLHLKQNGNCHKVIVVNRNKIDTT